MDHKTERLWVGSIKVDPDIDVRMTTNPSAVKRYAEVAPNLPPVTVFRLPDGTLLLAGGFHRFEAYRQRVDEDSEPKAASEFGHIPATVIDGTRAEAIAFAATDNARHGLPLSQDERDAAIVRLKNIGWAQVDIATAFGLSEARVSHILAELRGASRSHTVSATEVWRLRALRNASRREHRRPRTASTPGLTLHQLMQQLWAKPESGTAPGQKGDPALFTPVAVDPKRPRPVTDGHAADPVALAVRQAIGALREALAGCVERLQTAETLEDLMDVVAASRRAADLAVKAATQAKGGRVGVLQAKGKRKAS